MLKHLIIYVEQLYPATIGVGFHATTYGSKAKTWLNFLDVSERLLQQLFCVAMVPSYLGARTGDYMSIYHLILWWSEVKIFWVQDWWLYNIWSTEKWDQKCSTYIWSKHTMRNKIWVYEQIDNAFLCYKCCWEKKVPNSIVYRIRTHVIHHIYIIKHPFVELSTIYRANRATVTSSSVHHKWCYEITQQAALFLLLMGVGDPLFPGLCDRCPVCVSLVSFSLDNRDPCETLELISCLRRVSICPSNILTSSSFSTSCFRRFLISASFSRSDLISIGSASCSGLNTIHEQVCPYSLVFSCMLVFGKLMHYLHTVSV